MKKWIALIPAYEPTMLLPHLLSKIRCADFEAVVVDDGSGNSYSHIFEECSPFATVLKHSKNMGKGYALKSGFFYIQNHFHGNYIVVTLDCDGQHTVSDAKKICQTAQEYPDTLVLGSRKLQNHVPLRSRFGNAVTRLVYQIFTGLKIRDTQTGLRAFSNKLLLDFLNIPGDRYEYEMNVLLACSSRKIPIREVEIETIYLDNNSSSHFHALKDSCRIYREILKFSASSFISFLIDYILYTFLLFLTSESVSSLWISNIGARIISSGINYMLNRKLVFKSQNNVATSAFQYIILAVVILTGNTLLLTFLTSNVKINQYAAKILTEIFFFFFSWLIQRCIIFRRKEK